MKKSNVKRISMFALFIGAAGIMVACGNSEESSGSNESSDGNEANDVVEIEYFVASQAGEPDYELFIDAVNQFDEDHPNIDLKIESVAHNDYSTRLTTRAAGGELPDIFQITPISALTNIVNSGSAGSISDFKDHWIDEGLLTEDSLSEFTMDGEVYALPINSNPTQFIYYDVDMLSDVGYDSFPESYDEFIQLINDLNDADITPISLGNSSPWVLQSVYLSGIADRFTGSDFLDQVQSGERKFTDSDFVEALEVIEELVELEAFNEDLNTIDNQQMVNNFLQGNSAMVIDGNWSSATIAENSPDDKNIDIAIFPLGDSNTIPTTMGNVSAINSDLSEEKRAAVETFLKEVYNEDVFSGFLSLGKPVPGDIDIPEEDLDPLSVKMIELIQSADQSPVYDAVLPTGIINTMQNALQSITIGEYTAEEAAEEIQKEVTIEE
ncbi:ABC transporter substrate-binding protein [Salipaludibacillus sp. HK11]|uniref:ABC transporter substrate-binding protein n=1 Tax=Salipaludibacillus sp. HK11 TaxID=3394320 RepID=UPI0039FCCB3D